MEVSQMVQEGSNTACHLIVAQRNLRKYMNIRTWLWYGFWQQLKPKLQVGREAKMLADLEAAAVEAEEKVIIANEKNVKFGGENEVLIAEKNALLEALEESKGGAAQYLAKEEKLLSEKADVEGQLKDATNRLDNETEAKNALYQAMKKTEAEVGKTKGDLEDMEAKLGAAQADKETKDAQLKNLGEEIAHQEELISKLNKEKKALLESNQRTSEDHQSIEDKCNHLTKLKGKLEQNLDELEDSLEREKKLRGDMEKAKRKVEGDFKLAQEAVSDLERNQKELENTLARIDELEDEYKNEVNAKAKAEKAKQALARNVEEIGARLDEAGGAAAAQVELNKKREVELAKFKRDLEEMNIQHEAVLSSLRKKHNDAIAEMSEQVDYLNKMKARSEKDKECARMETDDAKSALDALSHDKAAAEKTAKQIQFNYSEIYTKLDDTNRTLNEFDGMKKKLYVENQDLVRQLEEAELQYGTLSKLKLSLTNQYDDARKMADDESRDRASLLGKSRNL